MTMAPRNETLGTNLRARRPGTNETLTRTDGGNTVAAENPSLNRADTISKHLSETDTTKSACVERRAPGHTLLYLHAKIPIALNIHRNNCIAH